MFGTSQVSRRLLKHGRKQLSVVFERRVMIPSIYRYGVHVLYLKRWNCRFVTETAGGKTDVDERELTCSEGSTLSAWAWGQ